MPTSAVVELMVLSGVENTSLVKFTGEPYTDSEHVAFQMPLSLWEDLGNPRGLRVRVEDTWNDPARTWEPAKSTLQERINIVKRHLAEVKSRNVRGMEIILPFPQYIDMAEKLLDVVERESAVFTQDNLYVIWQALGHVGLPHTEELAAQVKAMADKRAEEGVL